MLCLKTQATSIFRTIRSKMAATKTHALSYKNLGDILPVQMAMENDTPYFKADSLCCSNVKVPKLTEYICGGSLKSSVSVKTSVRIPYKNITVYDAPSHDCALIYADGRRRGFESKIVNQNLEIICRSEGLLKLMCQLIDNNPNHKFKTFEQVVCASGMVESPYMCVLQWKLCTATKGITGVRGFVLSDLAVVHILHKTTTVRSGECKRFMSSVLHDLALSCSFKYKKPGTTPLKLKVSLKPTKIIDHFESALPPYTSPCLNTCRVFDTAYSIQFPMGFWNCVERLRLRNEIESEMRQKIEIEMRQKICAVLNI